MRPPHSNEETARMCGSVNKAREKGMSTSIYLLEDGVYTAKKG